MPEWKSNLDAIDREQNSDFNRVRFQLIVTAVQPTIERFKVLYVLEIIAFLRTAPIECSCLNLSIQFRIQVNVNLERSLQCD